MENVSERILVINPIISKLFDKFAAGTSICQTLGRVSVSKWRNWSLVQRRLRQPTMKPLSLPDVIEKTLDAERRGFVVVINCFLDPGLRGARQLFEYLS